ncbi:MAG TPA: DNA primase [Chitinophagaceae bacterium]|nr:MAG: DNA primase [Bacteroidetes bacterium OLB11]HMN32621.1 DNA primase [Chitinophagaceae bacterium]
MISQATIQKVNDVADILDVVGTFVHLKKRGANYLGNCPFHNEKTPSFTVSPSKGIYKCFGCGKAGNSITFIQEHEKLTYPETIRWLAKKYHIEIEETLQSSEDKDKQQMEDSLRIINQFASDYFHDTLYSTEEGKAIGLSYFKERNFRNETIDKFHLGYCLEDKNIFPNAALDKKYKKEFLIKAGLVGEKNNQLFALYSGRVIFPIHNQSGRIIGFGARILKKNDKSPKYINTPENELYIKSKTLYGLFQSKNAISKQNECLLVEGYTDVISLHQSGVENVVASSGTSLTEGQLNLIKRFTNNLTILYDGDAAGIKAALRGLDMAIEHGMNVHVVLLPDNHDPDSYITSVGAENFNQFIAQNKKDIIVFKLEVSLKEAKDDSVKKSILINEIAETLSKINRLEDFSKQQDYIRRCSQLLGIEEEGLVSLVNKKIREKVVKKTQIEESEAKKLEAQANPETNHIQNDSLELLKKDYLQEKALIKILIEYGEKPYDENVHVAEYVRLKVGDVDFVNPIWQNIFNEYYRYIDHHLQFPNEKYFSYHDDEQIRSAAIEALYFPYDLSENWFHKHQIIVPTKESLYLQEVESTVLYFLLRKVKNISQELLNELKTNQNDLQEEMIIQTSLLELKKNEIALLTTIKTVLVR